MRCADPRFDAHLFLVERVVGLAWRRRWPIDRDDARQAGMLGLFQACQRIPADAEGFEFVAWYRVRGAVIDEARRSGLRRACRVITTADLAEHAAGARALGQLPKAVFDDDGAISDWTDTAPSPEELLVERERRAIAQAAIARMGGRRAAVLTRTLAGEKHRAIAQDMGVSEPRISQLCADAIALVVGATANEGRVPRKSPNTDEDLLWYLASPGKHNARTLSERFGMSLAAAQGRINKLREKGLLSKEWGDFSPSAEGMARIGRRLASPPEFAAPAPAEVALAPAVPEVVAAPPEARPDTSAREGLRRETQRWRDDVREIVAELLATQNQQVADSNAALRLRVTELEAECAALRAQRTKAIERLGFAAEALTGGAA